MAQARASRSAPATEQVKVKMLEQELAEGTAVQMDRWLEEEMALVMGCEVRRALESASDWEEESP